jgi:hypothetical protein
MTRVSNLGIFQPGEPIELIGGELIVAEPQGALHYTAICKTAKALEAAFGGGWVVRLQGPIGLEVYREPAPDPSALFGWRYARREVFDSLAHVSPLAAPAASIPVGNLLP